MAYQASCWISTSWEGSIPMRPSATLTWCWITCFSYRGLQRSISVWLGPSFYVYWELTSSQWWENGVLEVVDPLSRLWKCTKGQLGANISHLSLLSTLSARVPCGRLWGLGSPLRLVLFPFLEFSFVACSHANCIILQNFVLHLTCGWCFFLQRWVVRYGLITSGTDLSLRKFP